MAIFWIVIGVAVLDVAGDILINQWVKTSSSTWLIVAIPMAIGAAIMFGQVLRQKHFSFAVAVIVVVIVHSGIVLAWDYFVEKAFLSPMQWVGVAAGITAIVLMEVGGRK